MCVKSTLARAERQINEKSYYDRYNIKIQIAINRYKKVVIKRNKFIKR